MKNKLYIGFILIILSMIGFPLSDNIWHQIGNCLLTILGIIILVINGKKKDLH
jgi:hypothetical protein